METGFLNHTTLERLRRLSVLTGGSADDLVNLLLDHYEDKTGAGSVYDFAAQGGVITDSRVFRMLTDYATDLLCLHAPDGTYLYVSAASAQVGGYQPEEIVGTNPYEYFHPDDLSQIQASHSQSLTGERVRSVIYRLRRKDGSYVWLETMTNPVLGEDGSVQYLVTVSRDITEQKHTQEALQQERDLLSRIMETSPSGITVVDHTGQIVFANARAQEIHGLPKDDITARSYDAPTWKHTDYEGNPWPEEQQPFVRVMQTKQPVWDVRHAIEWSDGRRVYLSINGAPILDENGEVSKVVFTVEDYTQRKLQQDELEAALQREKKLNELKSAFVSMVSHEFRTPMAIIMTSTNLLRMKRNRMTEAEFLTRLDKIETQINHLDALIADVTFINKDDHVGHAPQRVCINIAYFFAQLADEIQTSYPDHTPIQITSAGSCNTALVDLSLMQHIFVNLLSNAMKYSPPESTVICAYTCDQHTLTVRVSDQGIGIPPEDQNALFQPFQRARNVDMIPGTGLGLNIARRAVTALGGTITLESEVGSGSVFTVTLPLA